jgi:hypothetical protein
MRPLLILLSVVPHLYVAAIPGRRMAAGDSSQFGVGPVGWSATSYRIDRRPDLSGAATVEPHRRGPYWVAPRPTLGPVCGAQREHGLRWPRLMCIAVGSHISSARRPRCQADLR